MTTLTPTTTDVLMLVLLLQVKHMAADFFLQTPYMILNRKFYGHPGGLLHVAIHLAGSLIALLVMAVAWSTIALFLVVEAVIHYHLDWFKDNFVERQALTARDGLYWYAMGVDQAIHHATYLAMAAWWVSHA